MTKKKGKLVFRQPNVPEGLTLFGEMQKVVSSSTTHSEYVAIVINLIEKFVDYSDTKHEKYADLLNDFDYAFELKQFADEIVIKIGSFFKKKA